MTEALQKLRSARRVGLVFSGGSARCTFQIGVIETLYSLGIRPAACIGVSAGAWNAAAVATGGWKRLRYYWRFFSRMPYIDVRNIFRDEHSPFIWTRLHNRAFQRYVSIEKIRAPGTLPLYVGLTRLRDKTNVIVDVRECSNPFKALLASNYLPPFYTHPVVIDGEKYGDGGFTNNIPYEALFDRGCDAVVIMNMRGESEGRICRTALDNEHDFPPEDEKRLVVIRPRHRLPLSFLERRWDKLRVIANLGALRAREVLLGERHPETDLAASGLAPSEYFNRVRAWMRGERTRERD